MVNDKRPFRRGFRLRPATGTGAGRFSEVRVSSGGRAVTVHLPLIDGITYHLVPRIFRTLAVSSNDFDIEMSDHLASLAAWGRAALIRKRNKILRFDDFVVFAGGTKLVRKAFTAVTKRLRSSGFALDGSSLRQFPELLVGWRNANGAGAGVVPRAGIAAAHAVAVVVHVYYDDLWPEIATVLSRLDTNFDLIVTTVPGRDGLAAAVQHAFPQAEIRVLDNRGRDVRPFLALLEEGRLDRYRYVCKIHTKKSSDGRRSALLGDIWRNRMFFDLLAAPGIPATIINRFEAEPDLGMIGPRAYRYPSRLCSVKLSWGENRPMVLDLAARMGLDPSRFKLDFFCGTMFWVRPQALAPLRRLRLATAFPDEAGKLDGGLEHAVERLLPAAVVAVGFRIDGIDGLPIEPCSRLG